MSSGGVPERSNGTVLKTVGRASVSWVRIPPPPPDEGGGRQSIGGRDPERFDRHDLLVRGTGVSFALGASSLGWPLASAEAAGDKRLAALARDLDGDLLVRGSRRYGRARRVWNARYDNVHPLAIAYAETVDDVRRIIYWAKRYDVRVAIRSGGHSFAGYSTTTGLVADVSRMSRVALGAGHVASVGAGARLGSVYETLWAARRAVPFGSCPTVGVAGLTFGGGHGFSSRAFGLACDNLREVQIVTAGGRLLRCSARDHPDLFWALRGAGMGSFGIATKLVFRTHPVGDVTTVNLRWAWPQARNVLRAWQTFAPAAPDALSCALTLRPSATPGVPQIGLNGQAFANRKDALALLAPLTDAVEPTTVAAVRRPFISAVTYFGGGEPAHRSVVAKSNYARSPIATAGLDALAKAVETAAADPRLRSAQILVSAQGGAIDRVGRDATAYVHRDALFFVRYAAFWDASAGAGTTSANRAWVRAVYDAMRPYVSRGAVVNYADPELAGWRSAYYGSHLKRLVRVKRRYDPGNFFRFPQSIPTHL
jgi:FAD/FMN-containing dehydrogenase